VFTAVTLTLIAAVVATLAVRNRQDLNQLLDRGTPLLVNAQTLVTALVNQETGIRGYALNGRTADLEPYNRGRVDEATSEANLLRLLADRPELAAQVSAIQAQAQSWRASVAEPVIRTVQAGDRERAQGLIDDAARGRFEGIRASLDRLQDDLTTLREQTVSRVRDGGDQVVELLVTAGLVILFAGVVLTVLLRYLVTGPVARLAAEVRAVAGGDYDQELTIDGPPEVALLARDVEAMRRELTRSNRDLEQFAYVASHDLQEPLRKVASFCQLLQRRYAGQLDERADQYIAFATDGAQRMQRLINDLLAFSRIGRMTSGFTNVDLDAVVQEAVDQRETMLAETGGEVVRQDLPVVRGEEPLLASLLGNLIGNSLKFRRPEVPPRIRISARQVGEEWEITCQDNGIGIDAEFAEKVFVIFQRLHAKEVYPGTGIGLAIAKKIVEYHGGRIWLDTDERRLADPAQVPARDERRLADPAQVPARDASEGTTIRFTLPIHQLAPPTPEPTPATRVEETIP
jgi:signal transduction histidine kinase